MTREEVYEAIEKFGWHNFIYTLIGQFGDIDTDEELPFDVNVVDMRVEPNIKTGGVDHRCLIVRVLPHNCDPLETDDDFYSVGYYGDSWDEALCCNSFTLDKVYPKQKTITEWVSL